MEVGDEGRGRTSLQPPASNLYAPKPVRVTVEGPRPVAMNGKRVDSIREEWLVEDRWWAAPPLRRHYVELVLDTGRCLTAYRDLETGRWFEQR